MNKDGLYALARELIYRQQNTLGGDKLTNDLVTVIQEAAELLCAGCTLNEAIHRGVTLHEQEAAQRKHQKTRDSVTQRKREQYKRLEPQPGQQPYVHEDNTSNTPPRHKAFCSCTECDTRRVEGYRTGDPISQARDNFQPRAIDADLTPTQTDHFIRMHQLKPTDGFYPGDVEQTILAHTKPYIREEERETPYPLEEQLKHRDETHEQVTAIRDAGESKPLSKDPTIRNGPVTQHHLIPIYDRCHELEERIEVLEHQVEGTKQWGDNSDHSFEKIDQRLGRLEDIWLKHSERVEALEDKSHENWGCYTSNFENYDRQLANIRDDLKHMDATNAAEERIIKALAREACSEMLRNLFGAAEGVEP